MITAVARGRLEAGNCTYCSLGKTVILSSIIVEINETGRIWPDLLAHLREIERVMEMADYCLKPETKFDFSHHIDVTRKLITRMEAAQARRR